jgi:polyisoprenoid-binding protein YceI
MAGTAARPTGNRTGDHGTPHRRRWWRWVLAGVAVLVVLLVLVAVSYTPLPGPPPLALPAAAAPAQANSADGRWNVGAGSIAGFRIRQHLLGNSSDIVGRTNTITGTIAVSSHQLTAATLRVDLTTIKVDDKASPQFANSLDTRQHPDATFTLTQPITLPADLDTGSAVTATATGRLSLHGVSRPVTLTISGRRTGPALEAVGSIPVAFSDWGIATPAGYGPIGSLDDHGLAEFLLVLHRQ